MFQVTPEMVLGKRVVSSGGDPLGAIVDVGVHDLRRVKFLLVEGAPHEARLTRLDVDLIDRIESGEVKLRAS